MNGQNLEIKYQMQFYTDSKCFFQRIHQRTKYVNV